VLPREKGDTEEMCEEQGTRVVAGSCFKGRAGCAMDCEQGGQGRGGAWMLLGRKAVLSDAVY
jgi:hypothetical protein